jgi:hypothetical protein
MENTNLLLDFLEGNLDSTKEDELFMKLNSNEGMRGDLKQYIAMDRAFNKKLSSLAPSSKSTLAVFSSLGLSSSAPVSVPGNKAGGLSKILAGAGKYTQGIIAGLTATALTSVAFLTIFGNAIFNNDNNNVAAIKPIVNNQLPASINNNQLPVVSSTSKYDKPIIKTKIVYVPVERQTAEQKNVVENTPDNFPSEPIVQDIAPTSLLSNASIVPINDANKLFTGNNLSDLTNFNTNFDSEPHLNFRTNAYDQIGLSIQFHGSQYWQLRQVAIEQSSIPKLYNSGFAIFYNLTDKFSIGFDLRNEHFYQEFTGTDNIGDSFLYRQFPNYRTYTGGIKWKFFNYNALSTFSQLMIGGTQTGFAGRGTLGLEYTPLPMFTFAVGFEGSFLRYMHQGNAYYSPKLGFNYGVLFNL